MKLAYKKLFSLLGLVLISLVLVSPNIIFAKEIVEEVAESVTITTTIPSQVSEEFSYSVLNAREILADPVNHPVLLTVYLFNKDKEPVVNKEVKIYSTRGKADAIEAISKLSSKNKISDTAEFQKDRTDENGMVVFRISSFMPGEATLKIIGDNIVELPSQKIIFSPLPFPTDLTLSIDLPFTTREWTIMSPDETQKDHLSPVLKESKKAVSSEGTKIEIPFVLFLFFSLIMLGSLSFIILNFISLSKIDKIEKEESRVLKEIAAAAGLCRLKQTGDDKCPHCDDYIKRR